MNKGIIIIALLITGMLLACFVYRHDLFHSPDEVWMEDERLLIRNLPANAVPRYVGMVPGEGFFVIWQPGSIDTFGDFNVNMGRDHELAPVPVTRVGGFRCAGGHIETERGTFVIEASPCGGTRMRVTLGGKDATLLEPASEYVGSRRP